MYFLQKSLATVFSALIIGLLFFDYFFIAFLISLPIFLIAGGICSYIVDVYLLEKLKISSLLQEYFLSIIVYTLGGIVTMFIFSFSQGSISSSTILPTVLIGIVPAFIYFHLSFLFSLVISRKTMIID
ncbi:hypothetical protein KGF86_12175 [Ornithinibacillus massiliensis]|uniref:Uncharacterized protein n=1 Tax=Ornithinibacillus massiliensis TaxID=1944633 RepID=A0ABS5MF63_9BACI|nr:hypothetical protein [Ornithinibacillus massiliensis]MBS3680961.1 hypothetical protein [Ornithinibacillus massiliensis]